LPCSRKTRPNTIEPNTFTTTVALNISAEHVKPIVAKRIAAHGTRVTRNARTRFAFEQRVRPKDIRENSRLASKSRALLRRTGNFITTARPPLPLSPTRAVHLYVIITRVVRVCACGAPTEPEGGGGLLVVRRNRAATSVSPFCRRNVITRWPGLGSYFYLYRPGRRSGTPNLFTNRIKGLPRCTYGVVRVFLLKAVPCMSRAHVTKSIKGSEKKKKREKEIPQ